MPESYTAAERRSLAEAAGRGEALRCPVCSAELAVREVAPKRELSYVRRRLWLICPACKRSATVDVRADGRTTL